MDLKQLQYFVVSVESGSFNKSEDILFSIIQKIPEKFISACLMNWMEHYTNKRISELKQQIIRNRWHTVELEKVVDNIHNRQQS